MNIVTPLCHRCMKYVEIYEPWLPFICPRCGLKGRWEDLFEEGDLGSWPEAIRDTFEIKEKEEK